MTIASALTALNTDIMNARTAITNKGGTVTANGGSSQLATDIATIPSGGSAPVITSLSVTPTTSAQTITTPSGTDGYSPVNVAAVTAAIDQNITAANIVSGISILGVNGSATVLNGETRTETLTSSAGNTFTPSSGKNAITSITVTPNNQARSVTPSTSSQTLSVNSGYSGNGTISVSAVTSSIDANILPENIKKDVTILSVTGTYEGSGGGGSKYGATVDNFLGDVNANGVLQRPTGQSQLVFTGVQDIAEHCLYYLFAERPSLTSVSFPNLTTVLGSSGMANAFQSCSSLTSVSFPNLTTVSGSYGMSHAFQSCSSLTSVSFPNLTTISGGYGMTYALGSCSSLTSVSFPNLTTISGSYCMNYALGSCSSLTSVSFPNLTTISGGNGMSHAFHSCSSLTSVSFPKLNTITTSGLVGAFQNCAQIKNIYFNKLKTTSFGSIKNQFTNMFNSTTASSSGTVTVHFPSNLSSTISGLKGYPTFGGNSSRVVIKFDLTATS